MIQDQRLNFTLVPFLSLLFPDSCQGLLSHAVERDLRTI